MAAEPLIGSGGVSDSWLQQKSNVKNIFEAFRTAKDAYTTLAPVPLIELSNAQMTSRALWESAATFLVREYVIKPGPHKGALLKFTNVLNYLRSVMRVCEDICRQRSGARPVFFSCLDTGSLSDDAQWFKGLKKNVLRETFERAKASGEPLDGSATPIYLEDVEALNRAFCLKGSSEAAGACPPSAARVDSDSLSLPPTCRVDCHPSPVLREEILDGLVLACGRAHRRAGLAGVQEDALGQALRMRLR
jgi:hypothetical protein